MPTPSLTPKTNFRPRYLVSWFVNLHLSQFRFKIFILVPFLPRNPTLYDQRLVESNLLIYALGCSKFSFSHQYDLSKCCFICNFQLYNVFNGNIAKFGSDPFSRISLGAHKGKQTLCHLYWSWNQHRSQHPRLPRPGWTQLKGNFRSEGARTRCHHANI
jgi:hypothetical protein